jgi:hypothetical protein
MRKRNREINIFNLSMLDVISGAMAAFLIIMIVLLPYYRKEHIDYQAMIDELRSQLVASIQRAEAAAEATAAAEAEAQAAREEAAKAKAQAAALEKKDLDLMIVLDTTGSMRDEMASLKADLKGLVEVLQTLSKRLRVGVVAYRDRNPRSGYLIRPFPLTVVDGAGMRRLTSFVDGLDLGDGVDWEENVEAGLEEAALRQPWNPQAEGIIVVIGDARAHPGDVQRAFRIAADFAARGPRFRVSAIQAGGGDGQDTAFFRNLAVQGGGVHIDSATELLSSIVVSIFK